MSFMSTVGMGAFGPEVWSIVTGREVAVNLSLTFSGMSSSSGADMVSNPLAADMAFAAVGSSGSNVFERK